VTCAQRHGIIADWKGMEGMRREDDDE